MLDHHDRNAGPGDLRDDRQDVANLGGVQTGQNLVEEQEARLGRERAREFEPLAPRDREPRGRRVEPVGESDEARDSLCATERVVAGAMAQMGANRNVLTHAKAREGPGDLERPRDPALCADVRRLAGNVFAPEADRSARRRLEAGDKSEQGRLAGAVRPDQTSDATGLRFKRSGVDREKTAKTLAGVLNLQQCRAHDCPRGASPRCSRSARPRSPKGANATAATRSAP